MHNIPLPIQFYVPLLLAALCGALGLVLLARAARSGPRMGRSRS